tara:strand:+ start:77 stop:505 length:429 start_codon:yes stop_codon:yes gene_type:complete
MREGCDTVKKEYNLKIKDNQGLWNVSFESKTKGSLIKGALIKVLWDSEPLAIKTLVDRLKCSGKKVSNTVSHQRLSNIIRGCKLFEIVGDTLTGTVAPNLYLNGENKYANAEAYKYKAYTYKLNKDYLLGWELHNDNIQGCK